jgi:hypothetical protein
MNKWRVPNDQVMYKRALMYSQHDLYFIFFFDAFKYLFFKNVAVNISYSYSLIAFVQYFVLVLHIQFFLGYLEGFL